MKWILLLIDLFALAVASYAMVESARTAKRVAALKAQRMPMGVMEIKLDSKELLEGIRQMLEDQEDDGEDWKQRRKE